ncbi:MAG: hypothetical protein UU06_C0041G0001, partial [Parcubacteria group bacterium GW2011_GWB1_40_5]
TKTHKIVISIVAIVLLLGLYIVFDKKSKNEEVKLVDTPNSQDVSSTTPETSNTTNDTAITVVGGTGNYTIEQVSGTEGAGVPQPVPNLDRKITVYPGAIISAESKAVATEKIQTLQSQLKQNTGDVKAWINLGIYQKMAGDYDGAVLSWKYAGRLSPTNYVSFGNLGNLYAYFLRDNAQAEIYYKQAISKGQTQAYLYIQLAEVYRDIFKDMDRARAIITEGLSKIPNDPSLLHFQTSLE